MIVFAAAVCAQVAGTALAKLATNSESASHYTNQPLQAGFSQRAEQWMSILLLYAGCWYSTGYAGKGREDLIPSVGCSELFI